MPLARFKNLPEEKQHMIVDAARAEFARQGEAASLNRIIAAAGISKGAMYYYFANKDDLFDEVISRSLQRFYKNLGPVPAPTNPAHYWAIFSATLRKASALLIADPELAALGGLLYGSTAGYRASKHLRDEFHRRVVGILTVGREVGAIRDDVELQLLAAATTGLTLGLDRFFVYQTEATMTESALAQVEVLVLTLYQDLLAPKDNPADTTTTTTTTH